MKVVLATPFGQFPEGELAGFLALLRLLDLEPPNLCNQA